jgi:hypothetical protein
MKQKKDPVLTFILGEIRDRKRSEEWLHYATTTECNIILYLAAWRLPFTFTTPLREQMLKDIAKMLVDRGYRDQGQRVFTKGNQYITIRFPKKKGYGTWEEIYALLKYIGFAGTDPVRVFSSASHLKRVEKIWKILTTRELICVSAGEDMSEKLQSFESKKDTQADVFAWVYKYFGEAGVDILSFMKNLLVNRIMNYQGE